MKSAPTTGVAANNHDMKSAPTAGAAANNYDMKSAPGAPAAKIVGNCSLGSLPTKVR